MPKRRSYSRRGTYVSPHIRNGHFVSGHYRSGGRVKGTSASGGGCGALVMLLLVCLLVVSLVVNYWRLILLGIGGVFAAVVALSAVVAMIRRQRPDNDPTSASVQARHGRAPVPAPQSSSRSLTVHGPIDRVWAAASDVDEIIALVPGISVQGHDGAMYRCSLEPRSATRTWHFRGEVRVVEHDHVRRHARLLVVAESEDPAVGCTLELSLEVGSQTPRRTVCLLRASAETTGRIPSGERKDFDRIAVNALRLVAVGLKARLEVDGLSNERPTPTNKQPTATPGKSPVPQGDARRGLLPPSGEAPRATRNLRAAWDYEPRAGIFVVHIVSDAPARVLLEEFPALPAAVERWAEISLPVQAGWSAEVIDSNLAIVLGYTTLLPHPHREQFPDGLWTGCEAGFAALRELGAANEIDLAIWEALAQRVD